MYFVNFHIFSISRMDDSFLGDQIQVNGRHWEVNFQLSMEHPFKFRKISLWFWNSFLNNDFPRISTKLKLALPVGAWEQHPKHWGALEECQPSAINRFWLRVRTTWPALMLKCFCKLWRSWLIRSKHRFDSMKGGLHYVERWSQERGSLSPTTQSPQRSRWWLIVKGVKSEIFFRRSSSRSPRPDPSRTSGLGRKGRSRGYTRSAPPPPHVKNTKNCHLSNTARRVTSLIARDLQDTREGCQPFPGGKEAKKQQQSHLYEFNSGLPGGNLWARLVCWQTLKPASFRGRTARQDRI